MALTFGFLSGMLVQQRYFAPPPVIYRTAPVRVEPASLQTNCLEAARICYARKRSTKVGE